MWGYMVWWSNRDQKVEVVGKSWFDPDVDQTRVCCIKITRLQPVTLKCLVNETEADLSQLKWGMQILCTMPWKSASEICLNSAVKLTIFTHNTNLHKHKHKCAAGVIHLFSIYFLYSTYIPPISIDDIPLPT